MSSWALLGHPVASDSCLLSLLNLAQGGGRKEMDRPRSTDFGTRCHKKPIVGRGSFAFARCAFGTRNEHAAIYRFHRAGTRVI